MIEYLKMVDSDNKGQLIDLYQFIVKNCSDAKGSSYNHQNWNGGYLDHIEEVLKYCVKLYDILSQDRILDFSLSDAILVLFLHDIEKPIKYSNLKEDFPNSDNDIKNLLIQKFKFILTEPQIEALKYIHGEGNDYRKDKRVMNPLCAFCHCCDIISARIFFDYPNATFSKL
jgi:hypothetical protein